ncbi:MAG: GNAT family N-acetyltransferase [Anaerolineales bacterium]|nr:GNAT family N-acetyltransferase [Anaerolineales bacterium]
MSIFDQFPILETERLLLRQIQPQDSTALFVILSDAEVTRYLGVQPLYSMDEVEGLLPLFHLPYQTQSGIRWAITPKSGPDAGKLIGTCGLHRWQPDHYRAEIGYELARAYWGQGIMGAALNTILDFGFSTLGLNRIAAEVWAANTRSARFLEKQRFQSEGLLRQAEFVEGAFQDILIYAILKKEFNQA